MAIFSNNTATALRSVVTQTLRRLQHHHDNHHGTSVAASYRSFSSGSPPEGRPFGPITPFATKILSDCLCVRVDMAGISHKDMKLWVNADKTIHIEGESTGESTHDEEGRIYEGTLDLGVHVHHLNFDELKAELKNGVLRILLPMTEEGKRDIKRKGYSHRVRSAKTKYYESQICNPNLYLK